MTIAAPADSGFFRSTDLGWLNSWKMQPTLQAHWEVFLERYLPYIKKRIDRFFLRPQDGEDLQQEIFSKILISIHAVKRERRGSFRSWLKQVVHSALCDWFEDAERRRKIPHMDPASIREIAQETTEEIDEENRLEQLAKAIRQVRSDFHESTWKVFELVKLQNKSAAEAAILYNISILTVYDIVRRVMERLRRTMEFLDQFYRS